MVEFCCQLLGMPVPPLVDFETASQTMSAMALSFWAENRRVVSLRLEVLQAFIMGSCGRAPTPTIYAGGTAVHLVVPDLQGGIACPAPRRAIAVNGYDQRIMGRAPAGAEPHPPPCTRAPSYLCSVVVAPPVPPHRYMAWPRMPWLHACVPLLTLYAFRTDNGSLRAASTLSLRRIAADLQQKLGMVDCSHSSTTSLLMLGFLSLGVRVLPVSCRFSNRVSKEELGGVPAGMRVYVR